MIFRIDIFCAEGGYQNLEEIEIDEQIIEHYMKVTPEGTHPQGFPINGLRGAIVENESFQKLRKKYPKSFFEVNIPYYGDSDLFGQKIVFGSRYMKRQFLVFPQHFYDCINPNS